MPSEPWYSAQGILWVTPALNPLSLRGGQMLFAVTSQSHLFCKKAESLLVKHVS